VPSKHDPLNEKPALLGQALLFGRESSNLKTLTAMYGKGFSQPLPAFCIRYHPEDGSRRLLSGGETTFIGQVLEVFK
jgi:hypothetical protein